MTGLEGPSRGAGLSPRTPREVAASEVIGSFAESGVHNSQPEGIGRVAALEGMCAWNNLGRNIVFAGNDLEPLAVFGETLYPDDDELSQYDLDVHAILDDPREDCVLVLNHLGLMRAFRASEVRRPGPVRRAEVQFAVEFAADVERTVLVGGSLVGSRPRRESSGGVLVSEPVAAGRDAGRLRVDLQLEDCGEVTAVASAPGTGDGLVALGGHGWVSLHPAAGGKLGPPRWRVPVELRAATIAWQGGLLWVAGSALTSAPIDDYDWEGLQGGGFAALEITDGHAAVEGRFARNLGWGAGGVAVVTTPAALVGVGRSGELCVFDAAGGGSAGSTAPLSSGSLGIAHAAVVGNRLLYGWNRDGYRLHTCAASTVAALVAGSS